MNKRAWIIVIALLGVAAVLGWQAYRRHLEAEAQQARDLAAIREQMDEMRRVHEVVFHVSEEDTFKLVSQMAAAVGLDYDKFTARYYMYTGGVFHGDGVLFARIRDPIAGTMVVMLGDGTITNLPLADQRLPR